MSYYSDQVLALDPIGHWSLDDYASPLEDAIGGHDFVVSGTPAYRGSPLLPNRDDASFNTANSGRGLTNWVSDEIGFVGRQPFTVAAWVRPNTLPSASAVIAAKVASGLTGGWWFRYTNAATVFLSRYGTPSVGISLANGVAVGRTDFLVGTYDGNTGRIYRNGVLASSTAMTNDIAGCPEPLSLGIESKGSGSQLDASIQHLSIWSRALTDTEVAGLHAAGLSRPRLISGRAAELMEMYPPFLRGNHLLQAVAVATGPEFEFLDEQIDKLEREMVPLTAEIMLPVFEKQLGLAVANPLMSLEQRKNAVIAFMSRAIATGQGIDWERLASTILGTQWTYTVGGTNNSVVTVTWPYPQGSIEAALAEALLRSITPASMTINVASSGGFQLDRSLLDDDLLR